MRLYPYKDDTRPNEKRLAHAIARGTVGWLHCCRAGRRSEKIRLVKIVNMHENSHEDSFGARHGSKFTGQDTRAGIRFLFE